MLFFAALALLNGIVGVINKMMNLQATKSLGTANGTLINYFGASLISLLLAFLMGGKALTDIAYLKTIPPEYFFGGVFGLVSMVLVMIGMSKNKVTFSTVVILIGQLGAGLAIESIVTKSVAPLKVLGVLLVLAGVMLDKYLTRKQGKETEQGASEHRIQNSEEN